MSGGRLNYFYGTLEDHVGDLGDMELDDLVKDLAKLFYEREWFLSGDTCEGNWVEARDAFKAKWFTQVGRKERIEKYLDDIKTGVLDLLGLSDRYCKNCNSWTPEKDGSPYGECKHENHCLIHRSERCEKFERRAPEAENSEEG